MQKPKDKTYRESRKKPSVTWAYGAISKRSKKLDKEKGIKVECLKCDLVFLGRINVRICDHCKRTESYAHGSTYTSMVTRQVC